MSAIEYNHFVIPVDANVQTEIERLLRDGWSPIAGVVPLAIYHMQRVEGHVVAATGIQAGLGVKEDGITIINGNGQAKGE